MTSRLLPLATQAGAAHRRAAAAAATVMLLALAATLVATPFADDGIGIGIVAQTGLLASVALTALRARRHGEDRGAWIALTVALAAWSFGNIAFGVLYAGGEPPEGATLADAGWVAFYPAAYLCIGLHLRARVRGLSPSMWLDGLVGVLALSAVGTALVVAPILSASADDPAQVVLNGGYLTGDLLLAAIAVAVFSLNPRRELSWLLLAAGLTSFAVGDFTYLQRVAAGNDGGIPLDVLWLAGCCAMALAAWQTPSETRPSVLGGWRTLAVSSVACLASVALLVAAGLTHVPAVAVCLAGAALLAAMARTGLTLRELRLFAETRRQATTDELTGLPNRRWFDRRLREAIAEARLTGRSLALMVIDLDHFKELNDTLGHHAGDRVLAQLGPRIRAELRGSDDVARLGGDEFAVLLDGASDAERAGQRIAEALGDRFTVEGIELQIAASIGIACFPEHGDDAETLLQRADVAMYQAKARRSSTEVYARERDRHTRERLQLIGELRDAVEDDRLTLHYQPKLDLGRNRITGVEALVRWPHPTRGMVPPDEFIPLAEQTGVIGPLTDLVIRKALLQAADWRARAIHLTIAVNVSATNLIEPGWTEGVLAALERHGVRPDRFVIEITEDVLMVDAERSLAALDTLSAAGVRVALDDFGTGYSSLSYLKQMRVDELKIDRSFVFGMDTDPADAAIVETAVDLGRRLGIGVVAEGVENAATLRRLTEFGAGGAQGYHIARPMPASELDAWMAAGGFVLRHDEDVERTRTVDALDAVKLDVGRRGRA